MISFSNVTSDWTRKDGLGVIQHSTVPSPTSKRSADGSGADKISAPTGQDQVQQLEAHVGGADDEQLASLTVFQLRSFLLTCLVVQSL